MKRDWTEWDIAGCDPATRPDDSQLGAAWIAMWLSALLTSRPPISTMVVPLLFTASVCAWWLVENSLQLGSVFVALLGTCSVVLIKKAWVASNAE